MRIFHKPQETQAWARQLARTLQPGDVIALVGGLGAGKTTFVQGLAKGWDYRGDVSSPTFSLVNEYVSRRGRLLHMDMYRLTLEELKAFPLEDYLDPESVCVIEWADRIHTRWPKGVLEVRLKAAGETTRQMQLPRLSARWKERLKGLTVHV